MMSVDEQMFLSDLAQREIDRLSKITDPIVRVCGPLTCDGPEGYQRNADRLERAEAILESRGYKVWKFGESEKYIQGRNFDHNDIIEYFHKPILESGLIKKAYFLKRWEESGGATKERQMCSEFGLEIEEFAEEWFLVSKNSRRRYPTG